MLVIKTNKKVHIVGPR